MKCARCWRDTQDRKFRGSHWMCGVHRRAHCLALLHGTSEVTEYALLRGLVFDFPVSCERDEAITRANYAAEVWRSLEKPRAVLRAHRMLGRVKVVAATTRIETLDLVTEFISFVVRNAAQIAQSDFGHRILLRTCAEKVCEWYPALIRPTGVRELMRAERVLRLIRHVTGASPFLVKADFVVSLNVPVDIAERIYVAYIGLIATSAPHVRMCCA